MSYQHKVWCAVFDPISGPCDCMRAHQSNSATPAPDKKTMTTKDNQLDSSATSDEACATCKGTGIETYHDHGAAQFGEAAIEPVKCSACDGFGAAPQAATTLTDAQIMATWCLSEYANQPLKFARAILSRQSALSTQAATTEQAELLPVGTLAWALIATNGNIIIWSRNRSTVAGYSSRYPEATLTPIIGASPAATTASASGDAECCKVCGVAVGGCHKVGCDYTWKVMSVECRAPAPSREAAGVDWLGLALELEAQAKRVESQTVERAMTAAASGLRLMGAGCAPAPKDEQSLNAAWDKYRDGADLSLRKATAFAAGYRAALAGREAAPLDEEEETAEDAWRRLALQFDGHRMQALGHLRAMLQDPAKHAPVVQEFLKAPPLSGEKVLAQRIAALAQPAAPVVDEDRPSLAQQIKSIQDQIAAEGSLQIKCALWDELDEVRAQLDAAPTPKAEPVVDGELPRQWTADEIAEACVKAGLGVLEANSLIVTLKGTDRAPAPSREAAIPQIKTWQERLTPNGVFVTEDGGFYRLTGQVMARDAEIADLRAALQAQQEQQEHGMPPTRGTDGQQKFKEPGYSDSLADRVFNLPCRWKGDPSLHAAILMGHTMACEQAYDLVMEHEQSQASRCRAQGGNTQPNGDAGAGGQGGEDGADLTTAIAADRAYINGMQEGWRLCAAGAVEVFHSKVDALAQQIREVRPSVKKSGKTERAISARATLAKANDGEGQQ